MYQQKSEARNPAYTYGSRTIIAVLLALLIAGTAWSLDSDDDRVVCVFAYPVLVNPNADLENILIDTLSVELTAKGVSVTGKVLGRRETYGTPAVDTLQRTHDCDILLFAGYGIEGGSVILSISFVKPFDGSLLAEVNRSVPIDLFLDKDINAVLEEAAGLLPARFEEVVEDVHEERIAYEKEEERRAAIAAAENAGGDEDTADSGIGTGGEDAYANGFELSAGGAPFLGIRTADTVLRNGVNVDILLEYRVRLERIQWIFGLHTGIARLGALAGGESDELYFFPFMLTSGIGTRSAGPFRFFGSAAAGPAVSTLNSLSGGTDTQLAIAARAGAGAGIRIFEGLFIEARGSAYLLQRGTTSRWGIVPAISLALQL